MGFHSCSTRNRPEFMYAQLWSPYRSQTTTYQSHVDTFLTIDSRFNRCRNNVQYYTLYLILFTIVLDNYRGKYRIIKNNEKHYGIKPILKLCGSDFKSIQFLFSPLKPLSLQYGRNSLVVFFARNIAFYMRLHADSPLTRVRHAAKTFLVWNHMGVTAIKWLIYHYCSSTFRLGRLSAVGGPTRLESRHGHIVRRCCCSFRRYCVRI